MIAGLPWESWLLLMASGGIGLGIELAFLWKQRRRRREARERGGGPERDDSSPGGFQDPVR